MSRERGTGWLRYPSDVRTLGFAAAYFVSVGAFWALTPATWFDLLPAPIGRPDLGAAWTPVSFALSVLAIAWISLLAFVGAISTHNVIHCPMFVRGWMNDVWRGVQTIWYGQPVSLFVPVHNHSHHKYAQTRKDLTRTTKATGTWQLLNLYRATQWQQAALRDAAVYFKAQRARGRKVWNDLVVEIAVMVTVFAVVLWIDWRRALVVFLIPHSVGVFLIKAVNFIQHDGCDYDQKGYNHSRNFVGPWFNWLFLNNGYHTVHHRVPGLHWSLTAARHAEQIAPHIHPALDVENFGGWFWTQIVWPGKRIRFDGAAYEWPPGGEGPDEPWAEEVAAHYEASQPERRSATG